MTKTDKHILGEITLRFAVVEDDYDQHFACEGCAFDSEEGLCTAAGPCCKLKRADGKNVHFELIKEDGTI